jgi:hypothetical protein
MNANDIHAQFTKFTTEKLRFAALDLASRPTTNASEIALDMAMLILMERLPLAAFNEICAEIEDMDVATPDYDDFNSVSSRHHY